jgi:hypothetical protein
MASSKRVALFAAALLAAIATGAPARSASVCTGVLRASLVHPMPTPLTIGTERDLDDLANPGLARRFADGLQRAGITLAQPGSATLSVAISVTSRNSGVASGTFKGFSWMNGAPLSSGKNMPGIRGAALSISAIVTDNTAIAQSWVGTLDCTVQTDDPDTLAEYIGNAIGRTIGKNIDRVAS